MGLYVLLFFSSKYIIKRKPPTSFCRNSPILAGQYRPGAVPLKLICMLVRAILMTSSLFNNRYGGGVNVLTSATSPLGPWTNVTASLDPGCPMWKQSSCFKVGPGQVCNPVSQAQQNYVITVPLADGSNAYVWTGDKWQQSPDAK